MSNFFVAGPAPVYVGTGAGYSFEFLGISRNGVRLNFRANFGRVECDIVGPDLFADAQYLGEEATVELELSRTNSTVLAKLEARTSSASSITAGAIPGSVPAPAQGVGIGTFMVLEGAAVPLCIVNPYAVAKSGESTQHACYVFGAAWLSDYSREHSTVVTYPRTTFQCINVPNYITGSLSLYSNTLPGSLPSIS